MTEQRTDKDKPYYERSGARITHQVASAIAAKSWSWTVLGLAWTAGPVTFIALQAGHYLGFGTIAPLQNVIYFAGYTIVAGILAVLGSIIHDAWYKPRIDDQQKALLHTIDKTFHCMRAIRNAILLSLNAEERKIMAAYYLLEGIGMTPIAAQTAMMDLTNSTILSEAAAKAVTFAEQGMQARVDDLWGDIQPELERIRPGLEAIAPMSCKRMELWLRGISPDIHLGIERSEGFIERVFQAAEEENLALMSLFDAAEMLTLAFELLNGRHIAVLEPRFKGDRKFESLQERFDDAWQDYRQHLRSRNSKLRQLLDRLYQDTHSVFIADGTNSGADIIHATLDALRALPRSERTRYRKAYEAIARAQRQLIAKHQQLVRAEADYSRNWQRHGEQLSLALQASDIRRSGFYLEARSITLTNEDKLHLHRALSGLIPASIAHHALDEEALKRIAIETAHRLDDLLQIRKMEEQIAVESSNAPNFEFITRDLTPTTKAGWAGLSIEALHLNRRKATHRVVKYLVEYFHVALTPSMIQTLITTFGAEEEHLDQIVAMAEHMQPKEGATCLPLKPKALPEWEVLFKPATAPDMHKRLWFKKPESR